LLLLAGGPVRSEDSNRRLAEIRKALGDIEGVTVRVSGDQIYLEGQAYTSSDAERVEQIVEAYSGTISLVTVAPNAKHLAAQNLNANFRRAGLRNVQAAVVGGTLFLEGTVESEQELRKTELITLALGENVESLVVIGTRRMILSEVQFVEVRHSSRDRYGLKYPTDITGTASASVTVAKEIGKASEASARGSINGNSDFAVEFQTNDGYGRLLAQPRLVCASGEQAEFLAGGEVPIPLITANHFAVEYKQYGILLKLRPTADGAGNIQTELEAEVSEVDTSVAVSAGGSVSVPGFRTRKVKTNVTVRHGETIVMSGVFSHDQQKFVSKLPALGNIPIIGELFKNRAVDSSKRELLIFVTPQIVDPQSERIRSTIEDAKTRYKNARGDISVGIFD
jgi:pilus assembly protein CpaC